MFERKSDFKADIYLSEENSEQISFAIKGDLMPNAGRVKMQFQDISKDFAANGKKDKQ